MNSRLAVALVLTGLTAAVAPPGLTQSIIVETIPDILLVPNQPIWLTFPDPVDPRPKYLYFEGHATAFGVPQAKLIVSFDYHLDPNDPPQDPPTFSPPFEFVVPDVGTGIFAEWLIPHCPPWVSIHFESDNPVIVGGIFVHECIPEPASFALVGSLGLLALALARRRRG